jgi:hypothetical protein
LTGRLNESVTQTVGFSGSLGSFYTRSITTALNVLTAVPDGSGCAGGKDGSTGFFNLIAHRCTAVFFKSTSGAKRHI